MRLQVKGKNVEVSPSLREYAERKLAKLENSSPSRRRSRSSSPSRRTRRSPTATWPRGRSSRKAPRCERGNPRPT